MIYADHQIFKVPPPRRLLFWLEETLLLRSSNCICRGGPALDTAACSWRLLARLQHLSCFLRRTKPKRRICENETEAEDYLQEVEVPATLEILMSSNLVFQSICEQSCRSKGSCLGRLLLSCCCALMLQVSSCRSPQRFFCEIAKRASCHFHECQGQIWLKIQSLQCQAKQQWKENLSIYRPDQCCLLLAELSSCDKILIKLHCRAWKNDSLAQGFSKQLQPFTCHFLNCSLLSSFLTTLLPCYIFAGSNQMISQVPLNTPHGIYIIGRSSPAKANLVEIYFAKDPSRGEARLKRRVWHGRCTSSQVQFFISPWRTHIWSPLKPPEMNVMKVQWVKYVGHELGMYQRVEHAVSTRLECNVPRYSTEHGSHKRWIRWINCIGSEGRWRCPKKGCSRRGVIVWPVV